MGVEEGRGGEHRLAHISKTSTMSERRTVRLPPICQVIRKEVRKF